MAEVLSQSEVESLLATLDPSGQMSLAPVSPRNDSATHISVYDFKRPERVSKEQIRAFQALHEGFSREFGAALSGMLRTIVEVKLISVDQLTYSEFVFSLENPTCFNLLKSEGLGGHFIFDLSPSIIFPIVDRLLGGGKAPRQSMPTRPLTEIELRLVKRITDLATKGLENAWGNICSLRLRLSQVESNPQLVQIVPPNEVIVLVTFELTMGEIRGIINLCIPFNTIEPLAGKLSSDAWSEYTQRTADPRQKLQLETAVAKASVKMTVELAKTSLKTAELLHLAVGDVIVTEKDDHAAVEIFVEGRPMFEGSAGLHKGHKAIRISKTVARPQDLVEAKLTERGLKEKSQASDPHHAVI